MSESSATPSSPVSLMDLDATFLPVSQMRQVSRVTQVDGSTITGEVELGETHWVYAQHFPGDPIFPGTLMIEAAGQLVALWAWAHGQRGRPRLVRTSAEFRNPVLPADRSLWLRAEVRRKRHLHYATISISTTGRDIATVDAVLAVLPEA